MLLEALAKRLVRQYDTACPCSYVRGSDALVGHLASVSPFCVACCMLRIIAHATRNTLHRRMAMRTSNDPLVVNHTECGGWGGLEGGVPPPNHPPQSLWRTTRGRMYEPDENTRLEGHESRDRLFTRSVRLAREQ